MSQSLVILQYHHISDSTPKSTSLSPELFKQHLKYLKENDFKVLKLNNVIKSLKRGENFQDKTVVITFDDGYRSIYETAFPVLKKYQFPFTIFVHTSPIENQLSQFVSWQNLKEMTDFGASIGNHTVNHQHLIPKNIKDDWQRRKAIITDEILNSQNVLENKAANVLRVFAYPYGEFDLQTKNLVKNLGFVAFGQHSGALPLIPDLLSIPRFPLGGNYGDMPDFKIKVNSLAMPTEQITLLTETGDEIKDHLLDQKVKKPKLRLLIALHEQELQIQCFSSRGNKLSKKVIQNGYEFTPSNNLPIGRSRFNCTAPAQVEGRFYWFSQPWILPDNKGNYYRE